MVTVIVNIVLLLGTAEAESYATNTLKGEAYDGTFEIGYDAFPESLKGSWSMLVKSHLKHTWQNPEFQLKMVGREQANGMQVERVILMENIACILEPDTTCVLTGFFSFPTKLFVQSATVELVGGFRQPTPEERDAQLEIAIQKDRKERAQERAKQEAEHETDLAEQKRLRAVCSRLYFQTANKRVSDLTVSQTQRVQACTSLGYYER